MKNQLLHTPEGVRDIYNSECKKKQALQDRLRKAMESYGYQIIQTPTFEFFDIFGKEIGTTFYCKGRRHVFWGRRYAAAVLLYGQYVYQ